MHPTAQPLPKETDSGTPGTFYQDIEGMDRFRIATRAFPLICSGGQSLRLIPKIVELKGVKFELIQEKPTNCVYRETKKGRKK